MTVQNRENADEESLLPKRLWIGGSSGLARTFLNAYGADEDWILLGHQETAPEWMSPAISHYYYPCDLTMDKPVSVHLLKKLRNVKQIVIGIRPPLVSKLSHAEMSDYCQKLVRGLRILLQALLSRCPHIQSVLHISSVAAANHLQAQHNVSTSHCNSETTMDAPLQAPYDIFKRDCERLVEALASSSSSSSSSEMPITTTSLRLSAIFSDTVNCIQCQALDIQSRIGSYLLQCIDCNSSRNVSAAIRLVLSRQQQYYQHQQQQQQRPSLQRYYYYTRPVRQYPQPVPYGEYLVQYRRALDLKWYVWIPTWIVRCFIEMVHWLALRTSSRLAFLDSIDYLLQVSYRDHCFDNSAFVADFAMIQTQEETIEECFRRRQKILY